jgi:hypothetical protein
VDVRWDSKLPAYFTNVLYCEHFNNLTVDGLTGTAGPNSPISEAIISLHNGKNASIKDLKVPAALPLGRKRLFHENVTDLTTNTNK